VIAIALIVIGVILLIVSIIDVRRNIILKREKREREKKLNNINEGN
jgi:heme exporter protein D